MEQGRVVMRTEWKLPSFTQKKKFNYERLLICDRQESKRIFEESYDWSFSTRLYTQLCRKYFPEFLSMNVNKQFSIFRRLKQTFLSSIFRINEETSRYIKGEISVKIWERFWFPIFPAHQVWFDLPLLAISRVDILIEIKIGKCSNCCGKIFLHIQPHGNPREFYYVWLFKVLSLTFMPKVT